MASPRQAAIPTKVGLHRARTLESMWFPGNLFPTMKGNSHEIHAPTRRAGRSGSFPQRAPLDAGVALQEPDSGRTSLHREGGRASSLRQLRQDAAASAFGRLIIPTMFRKEERR
jgi:hypothetical protein